MHRQISNYWCDKKYPCSSGKIILVSSARLQINQTQVVTTSITEKGYCLSSGGVDCTNPRIIQDMTSLEQPQTIYGFLAAGIIKRYEIMAHHLPLYVAIICKEEENIFIMV